MEPSRVSLALQECFEDPGAEKSGEYLYAHVAAVARHAVESGHREELLNILQDWIARRSEPETMLAVYLSYQLRLAELTTGLSTLRADIQSGKCFMPYYSLKVERALAAIRQEPS
jgi:hypothetical protein